LERSWGLFQSGDFQLAAAIFLSILLKLNKTLVILTANISIPPMIPVIIFLSYKMGAYWIGSEALDISFNRDITLQTIYSNLQQYIFGSITLAVVAGLALGILS
jgi:uncharacterized protein (DUF2062 family)